MQDDGATILGKILVGFFLTIVAVLVRGLTLTYLWDWFIAPLGVMPIGVAHAVGISGIVGFLTHDMTTAKDKEKGFFVQMLSSAIYSLLALGFGWIAHLFM
jgi:hypothetical protein